MGKNINMYHLAPIDIFSDDEEFRHQEIDDELTVTILQEDLLASNHLNSEQKHAYELILETLLLNKSATFFIDGPAGTGKTFLYKTLLAEIRSKHMIALATASSGVAASILPGGRTAHSRFKISLKIEKNSTCNVSKQGNLAKLLRLAKLIIWNEATMCGKYSIEAVDKMLQDINDTNLPFGGKVIVFCGDFRQVLPVIQKTTKEQQIDASLARSHLWSSLTKIKLIENMRSRLDSDFCRYLIEVGNGNEPITVKDMIKIPTKMLIQYNNDADSLNCDIVRYYSFDETIDTSEQVTKNWKVKMLVAEKSPKMIARNSITKYQNLTLIDPQGNRLQAVIFGKDIDLRDNTLQIINSRTIIENVEDDEPVLKV
ncbi:ATP-dependent DNA helicase PIF1-like [Carya illinoinensis]|uniref:ATP-dependent DNA helicase PIF1-like n=1 Tax=Carya illinoinensis TaxID=32201 RepID=UPI001C729BF2|nr:ATP-dependent DNA helicase PIF1-like [Carya illinoinensis]